MKANILLTYTFLHLLFFNLVWSQCPSGAIGVSGSGCGCAAGCNLTSFGGPNCSGTTGNCSAGQVAMSYDITVPAGCTVTVNATMSVRGGSCSASGADSGDQLKVDVPGGPKSFQTGASNATVNDSYTLAGPGTIRVSGTANRADEIITYSTSSIGCVNCAAGLPVELTAFQANHENNMIACYWQTESERDNDYFTVERSGDGVTFEAIGQIDGAGNSFTPLTYKLYDSSPLTGMNYYRLQQTDFNGLQTTGETVAVLFLPEELAAFYKMDNHELLFSRPLEKESLVQVYDLAGNLVSAFVVNEAISTIPLEVKPGILLIQVLSPGKNYSFFRIAAF